MATKKTAAALAIVNEVEGIGDTLAKRKIKLDNGATPDAIAKSAAQARKQLKTIEDLERDLGAAVDAKDKTLASLLNLRKKAREGVKGKFGGDSDEYAAVGGTKDSERKKPVRKPKP